MIGSCRLSDPIMYSSTVDSGFDVLGGRFRPVQMLR